MANKDYPVGKAQETILKALSLTATGYGDASEKFMNLGIVVASKRGVPVVRYHPVRYDMADKKTVEKLAQWFEN